MMVKAGAAEALGRIANWQDQAVIKELTTATKDKDAIVREQAGLALQFIDPTASARAGVK
jgi:HEAT repeat protein